MDNCPGCWDSTGSGELSEEVSSFSGEEGASSFSFSWVETSSETDGSFSEEDISGLLPPQAVYFPSFQSKIFSLFIAGSNITNIQKIANAFPGKIKEPTS